MSRLINILRSNLVVSAVGGVALLAVLGWLAFGFFGVHTLFIDDKVNEASPVFDSGAGGVAEGVGEMTPELIAEMDLVMVGEAVPVEVIAADAEPMPEVSEVITTVVGSFVGHAHPTSGRAEVLTDGTTQRFLRFEDFVTDNGPDLNVYLSNSSADAGNQTFDDDFIDLGDLKGNIGPQNYVIPEDVDLSVYDTVVIWCVRFGVSFGAADLS